MGCCLVSSRMEPTVQRIGVHTRIDVGQGCSVFGTVYSEKGIDSGSRSFAIARLYGSGHSFSVLPCISWYPSGQLTGNVP
jgi:hypothetical protein